MPPTVRPRRENINECVRLFPLHAAASAAQLRHSTITTMQTVRELDVVSFILFIYLLFLSTKSS
jgi:hypothetical protein